ncbi:hypothetical protein SAMN06296036_113122 [Pseudobacteriovorax antillogorgiicola]|uniref:Uncharacterized protein n=1 Tax=Pseudobacteriovorax antillogorgiicola TaxID=1513793 RepID=A0A1Y6CA61_9BACT|nr:hypothetical protein SAMN06296036_113120 [Pseudobacteriovorax antillogorgiicola]SMF44181.1 hypothetical protein SAMN06296036_113122 [Pseudobacteriovorax antillogorgiicola]
MPSYGFILSLNVPGRAGRLENREDEEKRGLSVPGRAGRLEKES